MLSGNEIEVTLMSNTDQRLNIAMKTLRYYLRKAQVNTEKLETDQIGKKKGVFVKYDKIY